MGSSIIIRKGQRIDLQGVYDLVVELAVFEKEPDAVISQLKDYQDAFDSGLINTLVAENQGTIIGMALFYDTFSTWRGKMLYLEDFYVKSGFRSQGIGDQIFDEVLKEAIKRECKILKWQVLDWNEGAIKFYHRKKATLEKNWWNGKILID